MSVFVSDMSSSPWTVVHDDAPGGSHQGTVDPAAIKHTQNMDGTENHNFLVIECPVCQATSTHPVGGGAQPALVQRLFVVKSESDGCSCGVVTAQDAQAVHESHVRLLANRMDGPARWQVADAPGGAKKAATKANLFSGPTGPDLQATQQQFDIVYRNSDRLITGMLAEGALDANYSEALIDLAEYEKLMATDPAYLSQDGHVVDAAP